MLNLNFPKWLKTKQMTFQKFLVFTKINKSSFENKKS